MFKFNIREFLGLGYYESEIDKFLAEFDKTHPKPSSSQAAEIKKYNRIYQLRDQTSPAVSSNEPFWDQF